MPILLLEATTLNTGHNWRFEADFMGEPARQSSVTSKEGPPRDDVSDVDKNEQLERSRWSALPERFRSFPLGRAVASSAAFPGGFVPVQIRKLYPGLVVELTDGGVHDNQGIEGLVDRGCTHILLSDGSGQMQDVAKPGTWIPKVLERVVSIYGDAEREERLLRAFAAENCAFFHLQSGLPNATRKPEQNVEELPGPMTTRSFGVDRHVQERLARVRTNLDAFCELEAWALAKDGHAIAQHVLPRQKAFVTAAEPQSGEPPAWPWDCVDLAEPSSRLLRVLEYGKLELLGLVLPLAGIVLAAIGVGSWLLIDNGPALLGIALGILLAVALYLGPQLPGIRALSSFLYESVVPAVLALPMFVAALGLWLTGRIWLAFGRARPG